eukprot:8074813-Karenia_brevis.AAC.1
MPPTRCSVRRLTAASVNPLKWIPWLPVAAEPQPLAHCHPSPPRPCGAAQLAPQRAGPGHKAAA